MAAATSSVDPMASIATALPEESLVKRGHCKCTLPVEHKIYYELHGTDAPDATRVVFIMGLNNSSFAWLGQVRHFGKLKGYSVLVLDNIGIGHSDAPSKLYKTSEMAHDVLELFDHVGWTDKQSINVVGVSMGGMVAQELALLAPERLRSVTLTSSKAGGKLLDFGGGGKLFDSSPKALHMFTRIITRTFTSVEHVMAMLVDALFPTEYLDVPDPEDSSKTRRQAMEAEFLYRFHRSVPPTPAGRLGQLSAALRHRVTPDRLRKMADTIPKIAIIVGDKDELIYYKRSEELHAMLPGSEFKMIKGGGHALPRQITEEYNEFLTRVFEDAAKRVSQ